MIVLSFAWVEDFYFNLAFVLVAVILNLGSVAIMIADQQQIPRYSVEKTQRAYDKLDRWKYKWQKELIFVGLFVASIVVGKSQFGGLYPGVLILVAGTLLFYSLLVIGQYRRQQLVRKRAEELGLQSPLQ